MTKPASESSSDGGRMFPDGETFTDSPLLPTPKSNEGGWKAEPHHQPGHRAYQEMSDGRTINRTWGVQQVVEVLTSSSGDSPASQPQPQAGAREPQTIAGYGRSSPVSLASWDPATSSWRTSQVSLLSTEDERFPRSWERWPTSGMTRHGRAFALPMLARVTGGSASSYLPTPDTMGSITRSAENLETGHAVSLPRRITHLHTPTTGDTNPSYDHRISPGQKPRAIPVPNLAAQVDELLSTPVSHDRPEGHDAPNRHGGSSLTNLLASPTAWLGRREAHSHGDPKRWTNPERSNDLSDQIAFLGEPTEPPSQDGSE